MANNLNYDRINKHRNIINSDSVVVKVVDYEIFILYIFYKSFIYN